MLRPWQRFETSESLIAGLAQKVDGKNEIFSIQSDPLTASLVSCLGLQFELGNPTLDRTSFLLGVNFSEKKSNPWNCEIITYQGMIGLRAWLESKREFSPLHEDFANILHPLSISNNELNQIFIFPSHVASKYAQRGIELVIVRDWALSAFLGSNLKLNYQRTNRYEIEENIALTQMRLLENRQLAFTGTHDLGDHLLGANIDGIAKCDSLLSEIKKKYFAIFNSKK